MAEALALDPTAMAADMERLPMIDAREVFADQHQVGGDSSVIETVTALYSSEQTAPVESKKSFIERAKEAYDDLKQVARRGAAVAAGTLLVGSAVEAVVPVVANASPAAVAKNKAAPPTTWSRLGGDPLVRKGVHSRHAFVKLITSKKGHSALKLQGLNTAEIKAVDTAARKGEEYNCKLTYGKKLASMVYGINGASIDRNVTFKDGRYKGKGHGAPAYCLDAKVYDKNGKVVEIIKTLTPRKCANVGIVALTELHPTAPKGKPAPKPKPVKPFTPGICTGNTNNSNNSGQDAKGGNCSVIVNQPICSVNNSPGAVVCSPETPPTPPTPPARHCVISPQEQKGDGRTWNIGITDEGAQVADSLTVSDGSAPDTTVGDSFAHTFPGYKAYDVQFSERFADGSTATCATTITTKEASTPPAPAP